MNDSFSEEILELAASIKSDIEASSKVAQEFNSPAALSRYLKDHPDADKSKHHVKKGKPSGGKGDDNAAPKNTKLTVLNVDFDSSDPADITKKVNDRIKDSLGEQSLSKVFGKHEELAKAWNSLGMALHQAKANPTRLTHGSIKKNLERVMNEIDFAVTREEESKKKSSNELVVAAKLLKIARSLLAVLVLGLFATGCKSTYYHARFPVIERPDRPQLENVSGDEMKKMSPEAQQAIAGNFNKLIDHTRKLEASVDTYNVYAEEQNKILDNISEKKKEN